jgi:hypothetical protein
MEWWISRGHKRENVRRDNRRGFRHRRDILGRIRGRRLKEGSGNKRKVIIDERIIGKGMREGGMG